MPLQAIELLKGILNAEPSEAGWRRLSGVVEGLDGGDVGACLGFLCEALPGWSDSWVHCKALIGDVRFREAVYRMIPNTPDPRLRPLVLAMFDEEVSYRRRLWDRILDDDGDSFENIYLCAFLLHRLGFAQDSLVIWRAKWINQDVGSMLGAEFMMGAGARATIEHLRGVGSDEALELSQYIEDNDGQYPLDAWREDQASYFDRARAPWA